MQLEAGTRLGPYEIVASLGSGGMGEVFRARDTRLHRDVAIKVLPPLFASDPERLSRFEREATTLASMNHPNIAQIYGLESLPGSDGRSQALVMELVEGDTLAERIGRGPVPLDDGLPIARQIADALEAAHDCGIVHRDLKPANIKVRPDGTVKVLDFGLAKAVAPDQSGSGSTTGARYGSNSPTMTSPAATAAGIIIGTAAYMSPEQARGKPVDARADIWAFGATLYELLTGKPPFSGASVSDVLASILRDNPDWQALPANTPASVRRLLRRCLQKDPQLRLRHAGDVRLELMDVDAPVETVPSASRRPSWTLVGLSGVALMALALVPVLTVSGGGADLPTRKWIIPQDAGDEVFGRENIPAISPDGRYIAYTDGERLRIRDLTRLDFVEVPGKGMAGMPTWSPDGKFVAFFVDHKSLWKVPLAGGAPTRLCDLPAGVVFGLAWRPDRTIVVNLAYGPSAGELFKVPEEGGRLERVRNKDLQKEPIFYLRGMPDGSLTYIRRRGGKIETVLERAENVQAFELGWHYGASYSPTGHLIYAGREPAGIWAVPFDLRAATVTGTPFRIAESGFGPNVSRDGTLIYGRSSGGLRQLTWVGRDGSIGEGLGQPQPNIQSPAIAPDGTRVAVVGVENGVRNIWIHEVGRAAKSRATFGQDDVDPTWHPRDGRIAFQTNAWDIYVLGPDGREPKPLVTSPMPEFESVWSPDGRYLVFGQYSPATQVDIWMLEEGGKPKAVVATPFVDMNPTLSPDGRFMAYASDETGRLEVFVRAFPGGEGKRQVSSNGGTLPKWRGNEIFFLEGVTLMAAAARTQPGLQVETPKPLFKLEDRAALMPIFDTLNGKRFVVARTIKPPQNGIAVVQNWIAEFQR